MECIPLANAVASQTLVSVAGVSETRHGSTLRAAYRLSLRRKHIGAQQETLRSAVSWGNNNAFGKTVSPLVFRTTSRATGGGPAHTSLVITAFTSEQAKLVKESWKVVQKNNPGKHALEFFLKVFEIAPSTKRLFSFLENSPYPLEKDPNLKAHALQVYLLTGESAAQLGDQGALDALHPKLIDLGRTHVAHGVIDEHFDVVKFCLLMTLEKAVPDMWSAETREAWAQAYNELVTAIKHEMIVVRVTNDPMAIQNASNHSIPMAS